MQETARWINEPSAVAPQAPGTAVAATTLPCMGTNDSAQGWVRGEHRRSDPWQAPLPYSQLSRATWLSSLKREGELWPFFPQVFAISQFVLCVRTDQFQRMKPTRTCTIAGLLNNKNKINKKILAETQISVCFFFYFIFIDIFTREELIISQVWSRVLWKTQLFTCNKKVERWAEMMPHFQTPLWKLQSKSRSLPALLCTMRFSIWFSLCCFLYVSVNT